MRSMVHALLIGLLFVSFPSEAVRAQSGIKIVPDVIYGHKDGMALTFDVFMPQSATGAAVLYVVSGGYVSRYVSPEAAVAQTDNDRYRPFKELLNKGFTVFSVRHGGSPKYNVPEIIEDLRRAVRFIRMNANNWRIDPERIGVYGGSSGGHMALLLGTASDKGNPNAEDSVLRVSDRVSAVVAYYAPVDFRRIVPGPDRDPNDPIDPERYPALKFERAKAADYSPLLQVSSDDPPTLLVHGEKDPLVYLSHSTIMFDALKKSDVPSKLVVIPGAGHSFVGEDGRRATEELVTWFEQYLTKKRP